MEYYLHLVGFGFPSLLAGGVREGLAGEGGAGGGVEEPGPFVLPGEVPRAVRVDLPHGRPFGAGENGDCAIYRILLGWKTCAKYFCETVGTPQPKANPTQEKLG